MKPGTCAASCSFGSSKMSKEVKLLTSLKKSGSKKLRSTLKKFDIPVPVNRIQQLLKKTTVGEIVKMNSKRKSSKRRSSKKSRRSSKRSSKKSMRSSRKSRRSSKRSSRKSKRSSRSSKRSSRRSKRSSRKMMFGKMVPGTSAIMGNNPTSLMSLSQQYTGMSPTQMEKHLASVPSSLRSNFYTNQ